MRAIRRATIAFTVAAGLCGVGSALAAPVISGDYYEENVQGICTTALGGCSMLFSATPSKILIGSVACTFLNVDFDITHIELSIRDTPSGQNRRETFLPFSPPVTRQVGSGNQIVRFYTVATPVDFMTAPARYPVIFAFVPGATGTQARCKITGRI